MRYLCVLAIMWSVDVSAQHIMHSRDESKENNIVRIDDYIQM